MNLTIPGRVSFQCEWGHFKEQLTSLSHGRYRDFRSYDSGFFVKAKQ